MQKRKIDAIIISIYLVIILWVVVSAKQGYYLPKPQKYQPRSVKEGSIHSYSYRSHYYGGGYRFGK